MLSNASMQHNKQNATCLGSDLTGPPSEPQTHYSITLDWRSTEVFDSLYSRKLYTRSPFRVKNIDVAVAYKVPQLRRPRFPTSAAVLLRNSVVIDVHSERNGTNRLTVSFRSPRQLLPSVVLRFRCYNIYLDRVVIMRSYGINHRTWFLGPARGQDRTQGDLFRRVEIVMN